MQPGVAIIHPVPHTIATILKLGGVLTKVLV